MKPKVFRKYLALLALLSYERQKERHVLDRIKGMQYRDTRRWFSENFSVF